MNKRSLLNLKRKLLSCMLASTILFEGTDSLATIEKETGTVMLEENIGYQPLIEFNTIEKTNEYFDIDVSDEYQDYLYSLAEKYEIPDEVIFTIGDVESDGKWNTNGVISKTNDYGQFQINICNIPYLEENMGVTKEDILNDPYVNADCASYLLKLIFDKYEYTSDSYDFDNVVGTYNGWTNWMYNNVSLDYVEKCNNVLNDKYKSLTLY